MVNWKVSFGLDFFKKMLQKKYIIIFLTVAVVTGGFVGWFARNELSFLSKASLPTATAQVRIDSPLYPLINPLLYSESPMDTSSRYAKLLASMKSFVDSAKESGNADDVSVYFRDLNSATWIGVNENDTYTPASMLKVVVVMATLKLAESNPSILDEKLYYTATSTAGDHYPPNDDLKSGFYTVQDLVSYTVVYSDNAAVDALLSDKNINNEFTSIYELFRLPISSSPNDFMSPKSFAVVFRTLYNSTLFQWGLSEQVMDLLTKTTFNVGLVAELPNTLTVAHKFGESNDILPNGSVEHELHDCGIIYYPDDPYLLCVMTKGQDFDRLAGVIAGISKITYDFVEQQKSQI